MSKRKKNPAAQPLRPRPGEIPTDVQGSYTGAPLSGEKPDQDADDL